MSIFTYIPKTDYTDYYDIARFRLTWRMNFVLICFLPFLALTLIFLGENSGWPSLTSMFIIIGFLAVLKITKKYNLVAKLMSVLGVLMCQYTLNFFLHSYHFVDIMWIMIIVLYTYFVLGKKWGSSFLFLQFLGVLYYINFGLNENLNNVKSLGSEDAIALSINFFFCFLMVMYLIHQFMQTSNYAEIKYRTLNNELENNNQVKTILLKEIHHRVKNNLQVISSLLRIQSREIKDEESQSLYAESINRVGAMALIHEKMYQTEDLSKINLEDYVKTLANDLLRSYAYVIPIEISVHSEIESLDPESLVPVALIFNELISNSIKHGFKKMEQGDIKISINRTTSDFVLIEYEDNGEWVKSTKEESFGLELIDSLTEQLNGTFKRETIEGTKYSFRFP